MPGARPETGLNRASLQSQRETTMLRLSTEQRRLLAEKMLDLANVGAGALVFGQALSGRGFSIGLALLGIAWWLTSFSVALLLDREVHR